MALHSVNGPSSDLSTQGRLTSLTGLLRTADGHKYCRGVLVTDLAPLGRDIAFWNISETHFEQLKSLQGKCVQVSQVQSAAARHGYEARAPYAINFNGGMIQAGAPTPRVQSPPSTIIEIEDVALWPQTALEPSASAYLPTSTHATGANPSQVSSTQTATMMAATTRLIPPQDLVVFDCLQCHNGSSPTCGVTGLPHPEICPTCGMLGAPVVRYCPMTGTPHPF